MVRRLTVLAIVAALLTAAACGGDDDDDGGASGEALTEAEFVAQANKICGDAHAELADEDPDPGLPPDAAVEQYVAEVLAPNIQHQLDAIAALNPPEELQDDVEEMLDAGYEALEQLESSSGAEILTQTEDPFTPVNEAASDLGLTVCAETE